MTGTADGQWRSDGDRERSRWKERARAILVKYGIVPDSAQEDMVLDQVRRSEPPDGMTPDAEAEWFRGELITAAYDFWALVASARERSNEHINLAWAALYESWHGWLVKLCRHPRNLVAGFEPEDVAQEVWLRLLSRPYDPAEGTAFTTWMYRQAWQTADALRRKQRSWLLVDPSTSALDAAAVDGEPIEAIPSMEGFLAGVDPELREALSELSEDQRTLLYLLLVADVKTAEAAEELGKKVGTVRAIKKRALDKLQSLLGGPAFSPGGPTPMQSEDGDSSG